MGKKVNLKSFKRINEDTSMGQPSPTQQSTSLPTGGNIQKDIEGTLGDSIAATKQDVQKAKQKKDELNKVLSVTKDIKKRNYPEGFQTLCANCHRVKTYSKFFEEY